MSDDTDHDRIAIKAHEIWESEGRPHGRDATHWDQAKEIIALQDSLGATLLPRETGASEPEESLEIAEAYGDVPGLTDQGRDDLLATGREPEVTNPAHATSSLGDTAGHVARPVRDETPDIDDAEIVTPPPKVAAVTPTPSHPMLGQPAPREGVPASPYASPVTAKAPPRPEIRPEPVTKGRPGGRR